MNVKCFVQWAAGEEELREGSFSIRNGKILAVLSNSPCVHIVGFGVQMSGTLSTVELQIESSDHQYGPESTIIQWESREDGFSFMPVQLKQGKPIIVEDLAVTISASRHDLQQVDELGPISVTRFENRGFPEGREIGWDWWAERTNSLIAPTVLGLSRDNRLFVFDPDSMSISAMIDLTTDTVFYDLRRATTADIQTKRSLEDGWMPILNVSQNFGDLTVEDTMFVSFADRSLTEDSLSGTPLSLAHLYSNLSTFPPGRLDEALKDAESYQPEGEVCLFLRTCITNHSETPLLAPQQLPQAIRLNRSNFRNLRVPEVPLIDESTLHVDSDGVYWAEGAPLSMHRVNGRVPTSRQPCPLLDPGQTMTIDSILSNSAKGLSSNVRYRNIEWETKLKEAKNFWNRKLVGTTTIDLPEKRLESFWKAGFAHLELVTLGRKTDPLLAKVGIYTCIGSESIPMVEFYDSIGAHDTARRCIDTFFAFQHPSGRINTYLYYDIETGAVLYLAGRHVQFTKDKKWIFERIDGIKAAADYLLSLRQMKDPNASDFGLIAGTCADPKELTTSFMLNSYNAAGLKATWELLDLVGDSQASVYKEAADHYMGCIQAGLAVSFQEGPVLPTRGDRWVPSCSSWLEGTGPEAMGLRGEAGYSHRSYFLFNALIGPLYAAYLGVISPHHRMTDWMLELNYRQFNRGMLAESQPYYSRHPELHLVREERDIFLNAFYSGLAALSDRSTFSFWEHFQKVSFHKTHEEAWALMQLRRMLWLEVDDELRIIPGIPCRWLDDHQGVDVRLAASLFGTINFMIKRIGGFLNIEWSATFHQIPSAVKIFVHDLRPDGDQFNDRCAFYGQWLEIKNPELSYAGKILVRTDCDSRFMDISQKRSLAIHE